MSQDIFFFAFHFEVYKFYIRHGKRCSCKSISFTNVANGPNYNIHETINCSIFMRNEENNVNVAC